MWSDARRQRNEHGKLISQVTLTVSGMGTNNELVENFEFIPETESIYDLLFEVEML